MTSNTPESTPVGRGGPRLAGRLGAAVVCALAGAAVFQFFGNANRGYIDTASLFYWWGFQWANPASDLEHGWLILGLSAWLFWRGLGRTGGLGRDAGAAGAGKTKHPEVDDRGAGDSVAVDRAGSLTPSFVALVAGLALHGLGFSAQQARVSIFGLLIFIWGLLRLGGGRRAGQAALFPLGFMVFAIPFGGLDSIGFWLRVWVVDASSALARGAGIEVLRSGTQLVAPDGAYNYDVAAACSGIRSLTAMTALSLLAGYLNFHSTWRRGFVLLLSLPLVYLGNVARIGSIIFAAQIGGPRWGDLAHEAMGYGVFVIVLGGVLLAIAALQRWCPEPPPAPPPAPAPGPVCHPLDDKRAWVLAGVVAVLAGGEMAALHHLSTRPERGAAGVRLAVDGVNPVELPAFLGTEWIGRRAEVTAIEREILPPDTGFSRKSYVPLDRPRQQVFLSIVLSGRDRTSIHRPELCLVGQGWTIVDVASHRFEYPGRADAAFPATLLRVRREVAVPAAGGRPAGKESVPQIVAYWFVGGDAIVATHWQRMLRDSWNRVWRARADRWAYVLMQTDASEGEAEALARLQAVLTATLPAFQPPRPADGAEGPALRR